MFFPRYDKLDSLVDAHHTGDSPNLAPAAFVLDFYILDTGYQAIGLPAFPVR